MNRTEEDLASQLAVNAAAYLETTYWWDDQDRRWEANRPERLERPDELTLTRADLFGPEETIVIRIEARVVTRTATVTTDAP